MKNEELKHREYVRILDDGIGRVDRKNIFSNGIHINGGQGYFIDYDIDDIIEKDKSFYKILHDGDLIEIEYYVPKYGGRISRVFEVETDIKDNFIEFNNYYMDFTYNLKEGKFTQKAKGYNPKIKKILTYEQFESECYDFEEE